MEADGQLLELKLFSRRVTWAVVFVCSALFVGGIHLSGVDLSQIDASSKTFNQGSHVCVRSEALTVSEDSLDFFEVCVEWIDLSDSSGQIHYLNPEDLDISVSPGGEIRVRGKSRINFRLIGLFAYVFILIFAGNTVQTRIIGRRKKELEARDLQRNPGHSI